MVEYTKLHASITEQIAVLKSRGMEIDGSAAGLLKSVGYFRLSGYWYPLRQPIWAEHADGSLTIDGRLDGFIDGASFRHVRDLWSFDNQLRNLILRAIEFVEVSLRSSTAHESGKYGPFSHLRPGRMDGKFTQTQLDERGASLPSKHQLWIAEIRKHQQERDDDFVIHHEVTYGGDLPIWKLVEILQMGHLMQLYRGLPWDDRVVIAASLGADSPDTLWGWITALNGLRNKAAHQARLWNASLPTPKRSRSIPRLDHLRLLPKSMKPYPYICILKHWMLSVAPDDAWHAELLTLLKSFPDVPYQSLVGAGFPQGWEQLDLWKAVGSL